MSLEQQIEALTLAVTDLADQMRGVGNVGAGGVAARSETNTATAATPAPTPAPAAAAAQAPAQTAAVTPTPAAAAPNAVVYPSNVPVVVTQEAAAQAAVNPALAAAASPAMTLEQLQQEVTAIYQAHNADPQVMAIVQTYAPSLTEIPAEHYAPLIAALRALP